MGNQSVSQQIQAPGEHKVGESDDIQTEHVPTARPFMITLSCC